MCACVSFWFFSLFCAGQSQPLYDSVHTRTPCTHDLAARTPPRDKDAHTHARRLVAAGSVLTVGAKVEAAATEVAEQAVFECNGAVLGF